MHVSSIADDLCFADFTDRPHYGHIILPPAFVNAILVSNIFEEGERGKIAK